MNVSKTTPNPDGILEIDDDGTAYVDGHKCGMDELNKILHSHAYDFYFHSRFGYYALSKRYAEYLFLCGFSGQKMYEEMELLDNEYEFYLLIN